MLILSRKECERVMIGTGSDAIIVAVVEIRGDSIRLGITAPRNVPVHREEIAKRIEEQQRNNGCP